MKRTRFDNCYYYVYLTTNLINGKQYIGSRKTKKTHINNDNYLGSGLLFLKAVKKYNRKNFSKVILNTYTNQKEAFAAEAPFITLYNTLEPNGYNISPTGGLGIPGSLSKKTQTAVNKKLAIIRNTPEYKKLRSQIAKQLCQDEEHITKIKNGVLRYILENPEKVKLNKQKQKKIIQSPEFGKKMSRKMIQYYKETPNAYEKNSKAVKKYYKETPNAHKKNSKAVKIAMNRPEVKKKISDYQKRRFQKMKKGEWNEIQKIRLSKPSTKQKMSDSAKKRKSIKKICINCNQIYYKKTINQFNKNLCDNCRKQ